MAAVASPTPGPPPPKPSVIEVSSYSPGPFATLALDNPELAACFLTSPGSWAIVKPPKQAVDPDALRSALVAHLAGLVAESEVANVKVTQAGVDRNAPAAIVHGNAVLLLLPEIQQSNPQQAAGVVAEVVVASRFKPAAPDSRCSEPLLALAEAISRAGVLALAGLPPALRPVGDWLDVKESRTALDGLAREALDTDRPWANRRAMLLQATRPGGVRPELAHAAAMLVEELGTGTPFGSGAPYDLLLGWREAKHAKLPRLPGTLRKALGRPLEAGVSTAKAAGEREAVAASALERVLANGRVTTPATTTSLSLEARLGIAATLRSGGAPDLCQGLVLPETGSTILTGCRDDEPRGVVVVRPEALRGFAVVWLGEGRAEAPLLRWPRWLLHPAVNRSDGTLLFVDEQGLWRVPLDGSAPPLLLRAGEYRQMAMSPDGRNIAAARRAAPITDLVRLSDRAILELPVDGRAGLSFLDSDVLVAADGRFLSVAALDGAVRQGVVLAPCTSALLARGGQAFAATIQPCEMGILRVSIAEGTATSVLKLGDGPSGMVSEPGGAILFATVEGVYRWREGTQVERIGSGLTPGPG
jgi:hypothetical protein